MFRAQRDNRGLYSSFCLSCFRITCLTYRGYDRDGDSRGFLASLCSHRLSAGPSHHRLPAGASRHRLPGEPSYHQLPARLNRHQLQVGLSQRQLPAGPSRRRLLAELSRHHLWVQVNTGSLPAACRANPSPTACGANSSPGAMSVGAAAAKLCGWKTFLPIGHIPVFPHPFTAASIVAARRYAVRNNPTLGLVIIEYQQDWSLICRTCVLVEVLKPLHDQIVLRPPRLVCFSSRSGWRTVHELCFIRFRVKMNIDGMNDPEALIHAATDTSLNALALAADIASAVRSGSSLVWWDMKHPNHSLPASLLRLN